MSRFQRLPANGSGWITNTFARARQGVDVCGAVGGLAQRTGDGNEDGGLGSTGASAGSSAAGSFDNIV